MSTYTPIASITLASAASSVTFSGIPQTYTDLVLVVAGVTSSGTEAVAVQCNSDTGSNYSRTVLLGNGTTTSSTRASSQTSAGLGVLDFATQGNTIYHFMNYSNSTTYKTFIARGNVSSEQARAAVGLWRSTSAITSITVLVGTSFASGTTFNLYGIANASITNVAKATGGDSVYTDGTYWYHIFRSSGTFTPTQALTADYLVVAGGGGAARGGGGAGGLRCTVTATGGGGSLESALSLTAQAYTVTIGAGGAGVAQGASSGNSGSNSTFATITSTGGGFGGYGGGSQLSGTGGSGGGAPSSGDSYVGSAGTANQGYKGGDNNGASGSGGGGGAGAAGGGGSGNGNGGNGVATSISGTSITYAGGGGGANFNANTAGTGGTGGGGNGATTGTGANGTANLGGGGGGGGGSGGVGGAGGSGIVIVRYAA